MRLISNAKVVQVVEALPLRAKDVLCGCVDGVAIDCWCCDCGYCCCDCVYVVIGVLINRCCDRDERCDRSVLSVVIGVVMVVVIELVRWCCDWCCVCGWCCDWLVGVGLVVVVCAGW